MHSPDCSEIKNIVYEGRGMDDVSNQIFFFPLHWGKALVKSNIIWKKNLPTEILEHYITVHLIKII